MPFSLDFRKLFARGDLGLQLLERPLLDLPDFFDLRALAGILGASRRFGLRLDAHCDHVYFVGREVDFRHCVAPDSERSNVGKIAEIARRVKRNLSWDEYRLLDKNVRQMPEGELVPTHDVEGRELPDPVPIAPPVGWFKQPSMFDVVRNMVRSEHLRLAAEAGGAESFEDASDFEVEDELFPTSQFEDEADFEPPPDFEARRQAMYRERFWAEQDASGYEAWVKSAQEAGHLPRTSASAPKAPAEPKAKRPDPASPEPAGDPA